MRGPGMLCHPRQVTSSLWASPMFPKPSMNQEELFQWKGYYYFCVEPCCCCLK